MFSYVNKGNLERNPLWIKWQDRLKPKGQRKAYHDSINTKKSGIDICMLDKANVKAQKLIRNEKSPYIRIWRSVFPAAEGHADICN